MRATAAFASLLTGAQLACNPGPTPCITPGTCPAGYECLANRCMPLGGEPVPENSERRVMHPIAMAVVSAHSHRAAEQLPAAITFGSRTVGSVALYLRFEPPPGAASHLHTALLLLEPMAGTRPSTKQVLVEVWRVQDEWHSGSLHWVSQPRLALPRSYGLARSSPPSTLRIDVTEIVRYQSEHPRSNHGLALKADGDGPHGASFATGSGGGKGPRLELYLHQ